MNELSLFSGAGGGLLGTKLLGFKHIGYVEFNDYCQRVIAQRIKDGYLDNAPIYGDIRTFIDSGRCDLYRGVTDIITAGFPCQPFSVAGKREASNDERNMWPATMEIIKRVKPAVCLLENVPGLLSATVDDTTDGLIRYYGTILRDLAKGGYDAQWCVLGADDVGALHHRKRLWIFAHAIGSRCASGSERIGRAKGSDINRCGQGANVANSRRTREGRKANAGFSASINKSGPGVEEGRNPILANTEHNGSFTTTEPGRHSTTICSQPKGQNSPGKSQGMDTSGDVANPQSQRRGETRTGSQRPTERATRGSDSLADTNKFDDDICGHRAGEVFRSRQEQTKVSGCQIPDPEKENGASEGGEPTGTFAERKSRDWWSIEPELGRVANGVANRVDRLKAIGNGQVPAVVAAAYRTLSEFRE